VGYITVITINRSGGNGHYFYRIGGIPIQLLPPLVIGTTNCPTIGQMEEEEETHWQMSSQIEGVDHLHQRGVVYHLDEERLKREFDIVESKHSLERN